MKSNESPHFSGEPANKITGRHVGGLGIYRRTKTGTSQSDGDIGVDIIEKPFKRWRGWVGIKNLLTKGVSR